ncbi:MAG: hypothetical protein ABIP64_01885, partial [Burkholderiales bacterium]
MRDGIAELYRTSRAQIGCGARREFETHWGEETALVNSDARGRGYAPRGKTPVAFSVGGTRDKLSMISPELNPDERLHA